MLLQHRVHSSAQPEWCDWVRCSAVKKIKRFSFANWFLGEVLSLPKFYSSLSLAFGLSAEKVFFYSVIKAVSKHNDLYRH